jgi:hypothetical protein
MYEGKISCDHSSFTSAESSHLFLLLLLAFGVRGISIPLLGFSIYNVPFLFLITFMFSLWFRGKEEND